jgi:hypothetical protein
LTEIIVSTATFLAPFLTLGVRTTGGGGGSLGDGAGDGTPGPDWLDATLPGFSPLAGGSPQDPSKAAAATLATSPDQVSGDFVIGMTVLLWFVMCPPGVRLTLSSDTVCRILTLSVQGQGTSVSPREPC